MSGLRILLLHPVLNSLNSGMFDQVSGLDVMWQVTHSTSRRVDVWRCGGPTEGETQMFLCSGDFNRLELTPTCSTRGPSQFLEPIYSGGRIMEVPQLFVLPPFLSETAKSQR